VYTRLGVNFDSQTQVGTGYCGESFYQDKIPAVIRELDEKKLTRHDPDGSILMFTGLAMAKTAPKEGEQADKDGEIPLFLSKSDGGFGYDSTDMAAAKFRLSNLKCNRVFYVTDAGQELHFLMIFEAAKLAGWASPTARLEHVKFGVVKRKVKSFCCCFKERRKGS